MEGMIWPGVFVAAAMLGIGTSLAIEGKRLFNKFMGVVIVLVAGAILGISSVAPYLKLDKEACSQYVQVNHEWTCVPWEEEG